MLLDMERYEIDKARISPHDQNRYNDSQLQKIFCRIYDNFPSEEVVFQERDNQSDNQPSCVYFTSKFCRTSSIPCSLENCGVPVTLHTSNPDKLYNSFIFKLPDDYRYAIKEQIKDRFGRLRDDEDVENVDVKIMGSELRLEYSACYAIGLGWILFQPTKDIKEIMHNTELLSEAKIKTALNWFDTTHSEYFQINGDKSASNKWYFEGWPLHAKAGLYRLYSNNRAEIGQLDPTRKQAIAKFCTEECKLKTQMLATYYEFALWVFKYVDLMGIIKQRICSDFTVHLYRRAQVDATPITFDADPNDDNFKNLLLTFLKQRDGRIPFRKGAGFRTYVANGDQANASYIRKTLKNPKYCTEQEDPKTFFFLKEFSSGQQDKVKCELSVAIENRIVEITWGNIKVRKRTPQETVATPSVEFCCQRMKQVYGLVGNKLKESHGTSDAGNSDAHQLPSNKFPHGTKGITAAHTDDLYEIIRMSQPRFASLDHWITHVCKHSQPTITFVNEKPKVEFKIDYLKTLYEDLKTKNALKKELKHEQTGIGFTLSITLPKTDTMPKPGIELSLCNVHVLVKPVPDSVDQLNVTLKTFY